MALGTWWAGDPLPDLPTLPAFSLLQTRDREQVADLTGLTSAEVEARWQEDNLAYLGLWQGTPVAYGWMGKGSAGVQEIRLAFTLPARNRYLWDFQTFPQWRGRGIYPHFLQAILRVEVAQAERFWILYKPGDESAARSIRKAGFDFVGDLALTEGYVSGFLPFSQSERAHAGAQLLRLPLVATE